MKTNNQKVQFTSLYANIMVSLYKDNTRTVLSKFELIDIVMHKLKVDREDARLGIAAALIELKDWWHQRWDRVVDPETSHLWGFRKRLILIKNT